MTIASGEGGGKRHVLAIESTDPVDSLAFLARWQAHFGKDWGNLADIAMEDASAVKTFAGGTRMRRDPGKSAVFRAISDAIHDKKLKGQRFAGSALMPFGPIPELEPGRFLDDDALLEGVRFARLCVLSPGASAKEGLNDHAAGAFADVIFLSAHQRGALVFGQPGGVSGTMPYFNFRISARRNEKFLGPQWLITSSCNVCNPDLLQAWQRIMQGEVSTLRGVLGFSGRFADAISSIPFHDKFIDLLAKGKTFVEAWGQSVEGNPEFLALWSAIVRRGAEGDTVASLTKGPAPLADPWSIAVVSKDARRELVPPERTFDVAWLRKERVTWKTRLNPANVLREGDGVEIMVRNRKYDFSVDDRIVVHIMCRRFDDPQLFDLREMFEVRDGLGTTPAKVATARKQVEKFRPPPAKAPASFDNFHNMFVIDVTESRDRIKLFLAVRKASKGKGGFAAFPDKRFTLWIRLAVGGYSGPLGALYEDYEEEAIVCEH